MRFETEAARWLGTDYPIIQGPFGGGLSTTQLAATVSNRGGLGSYGAQMLSGEEIGEVTREIASLTSNPFAMNLWVSDHDPGGLELSQVDFERVLSILEPYFVELGVAPLQHFDQVHHSFEDQVEALLEARPPVFSFVFGVPSDKVLAECRRQGIITIGGATTIAEAELLDAAGVDLILATGLEAGGHRPSFLAPAEESLYGTLALTRIVAGRVKAPIVAAGGIADGGGVRAILALGAQAAQVGTAFLACEESGTSDLHCSATIAVRPC